MIIIPARLKSSRFHEKILCDVGGVPMGLYSILFKITIIAKKIAIVASIMEGCISSNIILLG